MTARTFRDLIGTRDLKIGMFLGEFATPGIGQILRAAGADFCFVDLEHTGFTYETLKATLRWLHDAGVASLVRPPSGQYHDVSRACDMGAQGLIPPMMTAKKAREIANHIKYPTRGWRGVAFGIAHDDYRMAPAADTIAAANEKTTFMALIETKEGLADVEEIAGMEGVDGLFIGHFDLSCSLGIPAEFDNPLFTGAVARIVAAGKASGKALGRMVATPEDGVAARKQGFDIIMYSGDVWLLQEALRSGIDRIRAG